MKALDDVIIFINSLGSYLCVCCFAMVTVSGQAETKLVSATMNILLDKHSANGSFPTLAASTIITTYTNYTILQFLP